MNYRFKDGYQGHCKFLIIIAEIELSKSFYSFVLFCITGDVDQVGPRDGTTLPTCMGKVTASSRLGQSWFPMVEA